MSKIKAEECKCCVCGKQAVAFWPVIDPDIPENPYCRECLDKAKAEVMAEMFGVPTKAILKTIKEMKK